MKTDIVVKKIDPRELDKQIQVIDNICTHRLLRDSVVDRNDHYLALESLLKTLENMSDNIEQKIRK